MSNKYSGICMASRVQGALENTYGYNGGTGYVGYVGWGRDEMNDILQTTFSNVFSSMKMLEFRLKFHWSLF